ncbi:MAG: hypothetical protein LBU23_04270 [Planctomycetota bacterium]|nr:hypothetical protein [Planctomycetota bacterium]
MSADAQDLYYAFRPHSRPFYEALEDPRAVESLYRAIEEVARETYPHLPPPDLSADYLVDQQNRRNLYLSPGVKAYNRALTEEERNRTHIRE